MAKICMMCKKARATVRVSRLVEGSVHELWMCERCARRRFRPMHSVEGLLQAMLESGGPVERRRTEEDRQCPTCGLPLRTYRDTLFLGCSDCYDAFEDVLVDDLRRYHGATSHSGRRPTTEAAAAIEPHLAIKELQRRLELAVQREDFELAARLRDEIKRFKAELRERQAKSSSTQNSES
jgi:protein arginine kinase activator